MDLDDDELDVTLKEKGLRKKDRILKKISDRKEDFKFIISKVEKGETNEQKGTDNIIKGIERE